MLGGTKKLLDEVFNEKFAFCKPFWMKITFQENQNYKWLILL